MRLIDVYSSRSVKYAKGWKQAKKFFMNPNTKYRFDFLNEIDEPSITEIVAFQKQCAMEIKDSTNSQIILQHLNYDYKTGAALPEFDPSATIEKIESYLGFQNGIGVLYKKTKEIDSATLQLKLQEHKNLVIRLQNLYQQLKNIENNSQSTIAAFKAFSEALNHLVADVQMLSNDQNMPPITFTDRGYLNNLLWVSWVLKGQYLESKGTEILQQRLPSDFKVVNTGNVKSVYFNILGDATMSGKSINEDIMIFNTKDLGIAISYTIDGQIKNTSIEEFIQDVEKHSGTTSINLDEHNYKILRQHLVSGVNAKSGAGNIKFRKVTFNEIINVRDNFSIKFALKSLQLLTQPPYSSKRLLGTNSIYDAMFNYLLGRSLSGIIGSTNKIMLTRNGFKTVRDFLLEKFNEGYIIGAQVPRAVNLRKPEKSIPVGLKKY